MGDVFISGNTLSSSVSEREYIWQCVIVKLYTWSLESLVHKVPYLSVRGINRYMLVQSGDL